MFKGLNSKYHSLRILSFLLVAFLLCIILVSKSIRESVLNSIKTTLEFDPFYNVIIACSLLIGIYSAFYWVRNKSQKNLFLLFKVFGPLFDPPANCLAYGLVIASVLKLVKGLFLQQFFNIEYFKDFGILSVSAILLACIPLLIWSVNGLVVLSNQIFRREKELVGDVDIITNQDEIHPN